MKHSQINHENMINQTNSRLKHQKAKLAAHEEQEMARVAGEAAEAVSQ
jgi:hypothetical protein